jgi:hypothetical protein
MANIITAGNSTNGGTAITTDTSGTLDIKTGTGSGTTAISIDTSQNVTATGNLSFNSGYGSAAVAYGCRAWVNFNGTGTVAIRGSGNVTSITDSGVGSYIVNFTTAMPDVNYSVVGAVGPASAGGECVQIVSLATTGATISTSNNLTGLLDRANVGVAILR